MVPDSIDGSRAQRGGCCRPIFSTLTSLSEAPVEKINRIESMSSSAESDQINRSPVRRCWR